MNSRIFLIAVFVASVIVPKAVLAQDNGTVKTHQKISATAGNLTGPLENGDVFGFASGALGDVDGDGIGDLAVGARADDDGGTDHGAIYLLMLNANGTVKTEYKISETQGNLNVLLDDDDQFGFAVVCLGDLDGDTVSDLAVGAPKDDDGGDDRGAVYILFLNANGTVKSTQKISATDGNFASPVGDGGFFGSSLAALDDIDGDGIVDLAVGAAIDDNNHGSVVILFLDTDGTVKSHQKIGENDGNFVGDLDTADRFAISMGALGDLNNDGTADLAVGAMLDDDGGTNRGAVWLLFLKPDGTVDHHRKISSTQGGFAGPLDDLDKFGVSVTSIQDLNADGVNDIVVGAFGDNDTALLSGAVWVIFLNSSGAIVGRQKINSEVGGFTGRLKERSEFGLAAADVGDLDGDNVHDVAIGAIGDPGTGVAQGAIWVLFMNGESVTTPAVLQNFESLWFSDHVEVRWTLFDAEEDIAFDVWRRDQPDAPYKQIDNPTIRESQGDYVFADHSTQPGKNYGYHVLVFENGDLVTSFETRVTTPVSGQVLHPSHPNPFNPSTVVPYSLNKEERVLLQVFDVSGKLVRTLVNAVVPPGDHSELWDGRDASGQRVASGAYLIRLKAGKTNLSSKVTLLK